MAVVRWSAELQRQPVNKQPATNVAEYVPSLKIIVFIIKKIKNVSKGKKFLYRHFCFLVLTSFI